MPRVSPPSPSDVPLAVGLLLLGVALFTPIFAAARLADGLAGVAAPALAITAMRYLGGFLTVLGVVAARRAIIGAGASALRAERPWAHLLRALFGAGAAASAIHAASLLPLADAASIGLTKGVVTVLLAALILGERLTARILGAGALCALGAWFAVQAALGEPGPAAASVGVDARALEGTLAAFAGAVFIACEAVMIRMLARREAALPMLFAVNGWGAALTLGPGLWALSAAGLSLADAALFLLIGPLAIAGQYCNILAYRRADAAVLAPIGYSWILFSTALGYLCFGEVPGPGAALGAVLILIGGVLLSTPPERLSRIARSLRLAA